MTEAAQLKSTREALIDRICLVVTRIRTEVEQRDQDRERVLDVMDRGMNPMTPHQVQVNLTDAMDELRSLQLIARTAGMTEHQLGLLLTGKFEDRIAAMRDLFPEDFA